MLLPVSARSADTVRAASPMADISLPGAAGIGLRQPHVAEVIDRRPLIGWFEVHSENYFVDGGPSIAALETIRADYPVSLHGVGMSLGSADALDRSHVARLRRLIERIDPVLVSEHLCWSSIDGRHLNDLLPLPFSMEALAVVCARIDELQTELARQVLVENISTYLRFSDDAMPEWEFVAAVTRRTGCKLLLDVNNIYVNAVNHGFDPINYLAAIPCDCVAEIHLAGFEQQGELLIDTHGARVAPEVWTLYRRALEMFGPTPTLIEWDTDVPALDVLLDEAARANAISNEVCDVVAA